MAEGPIRALGAPPSGAGLRSVLARLIGPHTVVTSLDDSLLPLARDLIEDPEQVVSFFELVARFMGMAGQDSGMLPTTRQMVEVVHQASRALASDHDLLAPAHRHKGLSRLMAERLAELRLHGATAQDLRQWAETATEPLAEKLRMLADIDEHSRSRLEQKARILPSDRIRKCLELSAEHRGGIHHIVVLATGEPAPLMEEWIAWARRQGVKVDAVLECIEDRPDFFRLERQQAERFGGWTAVQARQDHWTSQLFSTRASQEGPAVVILRAPDPLAEVEWVLRECARLMSQESVMPHRIALYARDLSGYGPLLQAAAARLGVVVSVPISVPLLTNGYARAALAALQALAGGDVRALLGVSRSSYFPSTAAARDDLWKALSDACRSRDRSWSIAALWADQRPDLPWLTAMLRWRSEVMASPASLAGWIARLRDLVSTTGMADEAAGCLATMERDKRANTVMESSLRDSEFAGGGRQGESTLSEFVQFAARLWEDQQVSLPESKAGIRLAAHARLIGDVDAVFAMGLLEGSLPRRRREDPILSDEDRAELERISGGQVCLTDSRSKAYGERDEFVRLCSAASHRLQLSYPAATDEQDNVPAFYLSEVERVLGSRVERRVRLLEDLVPPLEEAMGGDAPLAQALAGPVAAPDLPDLGTLEARIRLMVSMENGVDVREIVDAVQCPFRRAARHRLSWKGEGGGDLFARVSRVPYQTGLHAIETAEEARARLRAAFDARLEELYPELEPWETSLLGSARDRHVEGWVAQEWAVRKCWPRDEVHAPARIEPPLFRSEPIKAGGHPLVITGEAPLVSFRPGLLRIDIGLYSLKPTDRDNNPVSTELDDEWLLPGLFLMAGYRGDCVQVVEFAHRAGRTIISLSPVSETPFSSDKRFQVSVKTVPAKRSDFLRAIRDKAAEAAGVFSSGSISVKPGAVCEACRYGEICRRSTVFGDQDDPFAEGAGG